jgi:glycogen operon protein
MLTAGDELWRTQHGNNNAYNQDNEVSWLDWSTTEAIQTFTRRTVRLRANSPALRQPEFFEGRTTPTGRPDLIWFRPDGEEMTEKDWFDDSRRTLGMWIDGSNSQSRTRDGELVTDHTWLLLLHAGNDPVDIVLPAPEYGATFEPVLDTGTPDGTPTSRNPLRASSSVTLPARTLLLLRAPR